MSDTCHQVRLQPNEYLLICPFVGSVIRDDNLLPLPQRPFIYCTKYKISSSFSTVYSICSWINTLLQSYVHFAANDGDKFKQCL